MVSHRGHLDEEGGGEIKRKRRGEKWRGERQTLAKKQQGEWPPNETMCGAPSFIPVWLKGRWAWVPASPAWPGRRGRGCQSRLEQEVWDPESWGSHVRMWPSSALPWQASAPSALPAGRPSFPATKTHMDTQRCTLSLPPSLPPDGCAAADVRARSLAERTVKDERQADEFVDCAV